MKKNKLYLILICFFLFSCNHKNKENKNISKNESKKCAHIVGKELLSPPPIENSKLNNEKLKVFEEGKMALVNVSLIADIKVDYEGKEQQIFRIQREDFKRKMLFALPVKFNMYWNNLLLTANKNNDTLFIEIKLKDKQQKLYKIFGHKYDNEKFGGREIIIKSLNSNSRVVI